jgi:hypothetical protein
MPPRLFPHFYKPEALPFFRAAYRCLAKVPQHIALANNGLAPCAAYEKWLGLAKGRVAFVPNGIAKDFFQKPSAAERKALRETLGLGAKDQILLGVFRLSAEKRPEKFLASSRNGERQPAPPRVFMRRRACAWMLQKQARRNKLGARVHLLGNVENVRDVWRSAPSSAHIEKRRHAQRDDRSAGARPAVVSTRVGGVRIRSRRDAKPLPAEKTIGPVWKKPAQVLIIRRGRKSLGQRRENYAKKRSAE